jgi:REP element-mobilizing transposase RayT
MPNHVHVAFQSVAGWNLKSILHSWKTFTAFRINQLLNKTGTFWQSEYYDHLIRGPDDLGRCVQYILDNPVKAKLGDWPWVWSKS